ncbi:hypothetical protein E2320_006508 [Naja naja]|nr:hypothetical protein E2320_006508 [Naja naja]
MEDEDQTWLLQQVKLDTQFLKALHVIDYSLLVGLQPLHDDDRFLNDTLGNILAKTRFSTSSDQILRLYPDYLFPYLKPDRSPEQLIRSEGFMHNVVTPFLMQNSCEDMSCVVGSALCSRSLSDLSGASFAAQHRRILPTSKNPLHTIDGPDYRYYVGIIDLFTVYTFRKKVERLWKSIRYRGQQFSTVEPSYYAQRLCQWVESHTI